MRFVPVISTCLCAAIGLPTVARAQAAQQAQPQARPIQPPPASPVPLGVSGQMAPWFQVRGEFRARVEGFAGGGFTENEDGYWMDRFRINASITPSKSLAFVVQAHDARAFRKTVGSQLAPFRDTLDLRMAYGDVGSRYSVRIGRQELAFGEQRLLGHLAWANVGRSFDGVRGTLRNGFGQIDAFVASVVNIDPEGFDKSGKGNLLAGSYVSVTKIPRQVVEPYFFWRQARNVTAEVGPVADLHQATTGLRMAGRLPWTLDYSGEIAIQTGSVGADNVGAWAGHSTVGKTIAVAGRPRVFAEYNYASGDADNVDGERGTFDQLYPTGHDKLGLADQVGWKNIHHARAGLELKLTPKWSTAGSYHSWWLASETDALYSASGAVVARSTAGTAGQYVGYEFDGQVVYAYSPQLQIAGGYAHMVPGEFLRNTTPGRTYKAPYMMVTYVFIGEQPAIGGRRTE
jgi:alginate export protein